MKHKIWFNEISTFIGYLMLKLSLQKNSSDIIPPEAERIRGFVYSPNVLVQKWTYNPDRSSNSLTSKKQSITPQHKKEFATLLRSWYNLFRK